MQCSVVSEPRLLKAFYAFGSMVYVNSQRWQYENIRKETYVYGAFLNACNTIGAILFLISGAFLFSLVIKIISIAKRIYIASR